MRDYLELTKPRISLLSAATAAIGYWIAGGGGKARLLWTVLGTALASGAGGALNQWLERGRDGLMLRTRKRPLPSGRLEPARALAFGLGCAAAGLGALALGAGAQAALLAFAALLIYLCLYTPLKSRTPQSTWLGAVSGALPPLVGWAAARGSLDARAWVLFAIQFLWQIPHFLALFWIYREDYARAGFKVMPVVDPGGRATACQIALHSFTLLPASLAPAFCGLAGLPYGCGALALGAAFLGLGMKASWTMAVPDARRLFLASLAYLPLLFGMLALSV